MIRPENMRRDAGQPAHGTNAGQGKLPRSAPLMRRASADVQGACDLNRPAGGGDGSLQRGEKVRTAGSVGHGDSVATLHFLRHSFLHCVQAQYTAPSGSMESAILPPSDHRIAVGARLRKLIDMLGMTYVDAAELMGISKHVLRNWMAGETYPQPYPLYRLCRLKGVDFNYVFLGDWAALPGRLSSQLEAELLARMADMPAQGQTDA